MVQQQKAEIDMWLEEDVQEEINLAKLEGLEAVRMVINSWHHDLFTWDLLPIPNKTANKLLDGEFNTFEKLKLHAEENVSRNGNNIEILYRKVKNSNKEKDVYIIETIFINE